MVESRIKAVSTRLIDMRILNGGAWGNWVVQDKPFLVRLTPGGYGVTHWFVRCSIHGTEKWVAAQTLRNGDSTGCELCRRKANAHSRTIDMGKRPDLLHPESDWEITKKPSKVKKTSGGGRTTQWWCRCSLCGSFAWVNGVNLRNGDSRRCRPCGKKKGGKSLRIDMKDVMLPKDSTWVIDHSRLPRMRAHSDGQKSSEFWCRCSVHGTEKWVNGYYLRSGKSLGCHLCGLEKIGKKHRKRPFESAYNVIMQSKWWKCPTGGLTYEEFLEFTGVPNCHYCADKLAWNPYRTRGGRKVGGASNLDRKDSFQGYNKKNVVACCFPCNEKKSNRFTYGEFVEVGKIIRVRRESVTCVSMFADDGISKTTTALA